MPKIHPHDLHMTPISNTTAACEGLVTHFSARALVLRFERGRKNVLLFLGRGRRQAACGAPDSIGALAGRAARLAARGGLRSVIVVLLDVEPFTGQDLAQLVGARRAARGPNPGKRYHRPAAALSIANSCQVFGPRKTLQSPVPQGFQPALCQKFIHTICRRPKNFKNVEYTFHAEALDVWY
jgi:hypothetical protein